MHIPKEKIMFGLFRRKEREVIAPVDGQIVDITEVPDEVFAQKMTGDGVAVKPAGDTFCAPISGRVAKIFPTNHAFLIESGKDLSVMVHIGLDTVALKGKGFKRLVEEGTKVEAGTPVIQIDRSYLSEEGKDMITPIVISDESDVDTLKKKLRIVKQGDTIMEVK
jgi:glucose-specific phosphotransferase system IIA component